MAHVTGAEPLYTAEVNHNDKDWEGDVSTYAVLLTNIQPGGEQTLIINTFE